MEEETLKDKEKQELLRLARKAIEKHLKGEEDSLLKPALGTPSLFAKCGAFVSLHKDHQLRGCIGTFISDTPLYKTVMEMAGEAAVNDPRFLPLTIEELPQVKIEISVLSPLKKIKEISDIEVGKHGLYIIKGINRGVLLPQVATEYGWDRVQFLENTCHKAGLNADAWKEGSDIYIFSAEVFSENIRSQKQR